MHNEPMLEYIPTPNLPAQENNTFYVDNKIRGKSQDIHIGKIFVYNGPDKDTKNATYRKSLNNSPKDFEDKRDIHFLESLMKRKLEKNYVEKMSDLLFNSKFDKNYEEKRNNLDKAYYKMDENCEFKLTLPEQFKRKLLYKNRRNKEINTDFLGKSNGKANNYSSIIKTDIFSNSKHAMPDGKSTASNLKTFKLTEKLLKKEPTASESISNLCSNNTSNRESHSNLLSKNLVHSSTNIFNKQLSKPFSEINKQYTENISQGNLSLCNNINDLNTKSKIDLAEREKAIYNTLKTKKLFYSPPNKKSIKSNIRFGAEFMEEKYPIANSAVSSYINSQNTVYLPITFEHLNKIDQNVGKRVEDGKTNLLTPLQRDKVRYLSELTVFEEMNYFREKKDILNRVKNNNKFISNNALLNSLQLLNDRKKIAALERIKFLKGLKEKDKIHKEERRISKQLELYKNDVDKLAVNSNKAVKLAKEIEKNIDNFMVVQENVRRHRNKKDAERHSLKFGLKKTI